MGRVFPLIAGAVMIVAAGAAIVPATHAASLDPVRSACAAMGLNPTEAPFADCVASLQKSVPKDSHLLRVTAGRGVTGLGNVGPFMGVGAQSACAAIGLDPATASYSYCVNNLRQTLFDAGDINAR